MWGHTVWLVRRAGGLPSPRQRLQTVHSVTVPRWACFNSVSRLGGHACGKGLLPDVYAALRIVSLGTLWAPELDFESTLHPSHRTHLYGAAYESPRLIRTAKGKEQQVGGKLCGAVLLGAIPGWHAPANTHRSLLWVWRPQPPPTCHLPQQHLSRMRS